MNVLLKHITRLLDDKDVLAAYDQVAALYPHTPSLSLWRAWEYAAYRTYALHEPVLDVGCGDGRWFRLVWPEISDVSGIDLEPAAVERARRSGVYRQVWQADAADMPVPAGAFGSVFANCSLEHMDNIDTVIGNVCRALRPGGTFIFSVVTDKSEQWFSPATLVRALGEEARANGLYDEWCTYHHLVNPFPIECWCEALINAGFEVVEHIPIIPEMTGRLFLLLDGLWHARQGAGELGGQLQPYLQGLPNFPAAFRGILQSVLLLETNRGVGCGAVLVARKVESKAARVPDPERRCWCGDSSLTRFSANYLSCTSCGTLVSQVSLAEEQLQVRDDSCDFYGKENWLSRQQQDLRLPDIFQHARLDLPERCLHWLRTLLAYKLPPARVLELGSAHGGLIALLRWSGFDATGLELSPWVVDFARRASDAALLFGPTEDQQLHDQSFDVIVLNDLLEHLADPLATLRRCTALLKPDGMLLIQTPCAPEGSTYADLARDNNRFLKMLQAREHLYLFSSRAVHQLFARIGWEVVRFEPAMFDYDMYFVVSRRPLPQHDDDQVRMALELRPAGRLVQALLDQADATKRVHEQLRSAEAASLKAIERLSAQLAESEADRAARLDVIKRLSEQLAASEADRAARLDVIKRLSEQLAASEADRAARLEAIRHLQARLAEGESDRAPIRQIVSR
jgi:2-polyprenyl-3-methyl-5-hydroxy-6-metoxy-1,4-benzoquinol methylase